MTQASPVVRRQVVVAAPVERAFAVFVGRIVEFKPPEHNLLGARSPRLSSSHAVIAVHTSCLDNRDYPEAGQFPESRVELPAIPDATGLGRILAHRAERPGIADACDNQADVIGVAHVEQAID
jgi:hypothetical protein